MADNDPVTPEQWNSPQLRRGILVKIQETLNSYGVTTNKSPAELERSVFQKATSKEQYLSFVARLIIHLKNNARPMGPGGPGQGQMGQGHQSLATMMQSGQGMQQSQLNLLHQQQQQQAMHQNQQINALQQQQLQAQMKSQMGQQQMQMQQSQMMANASNGLAMNNLASGGPNANKMNPMMMNSGAGAGMNSNATEQIGNDQMANMMAMQKAKQLNSHMGPNSSINTSNLNIVNSSFNQQMTINNSNVNSNLANMSSTINSVGSSINPQNSSATTITSILNSSNMKPKLIPNMMAQNTNSGNLGASHPITLNPQNAAQLQQGGQQTLSLQQQLAQQQQTRMMQPNSGNMVAGGMMTNTRMMMTQTGIRQQQGNQINITANLQAQLRLRQVTPGGASSLQQMSGLQQGQSGPIPIYLQQQQQQQSQQHQQNLQASQNGANLASAQAAANQEAKFFEITNVNQANQRITPVTVSQAQFKLNQNSTPGGNFVQTFNTNTLATAQQPQIVVSNTAPMNVASSGMSQSAVPNNAALMQASMASNAAQISQQANKLNHSGPIGSQGSQPTQVQLQAQMQAAGNKLLALPTPSAAILANQNMNIHSPSNFHVSSPASVQSVPMMSPAGPGRATSTIGAPSPQSALNTPASPGQASTPAQKVAAVSKDAEHVLYAEKLQAMQKYLQPLQDLINHLEHDERKAKELDRLRNLFSILINQRKVALDFLEKCEKALEKMEKDQRFLNMNRLGARQTVECSPAMPSIPSVPTQTPVSQTAVSQGPGPGAAAGAQPSANSASVAATTNKIQDICQPLIDAIIKNYDKPMFSHTLARTFGPALAVLHHEPYSASNQLTFQVTTCTIATPTHYHEKRKAATQSKPNSIQNEVLQGEIARLDIRFHVQQLIPGKRPSNVSRPLYLLCRLDDFTLPCVPPIKVYVSESYPDIPPHYQLERDDYKTSAFFLKLYDCLRHNLFNMTGNYTLTAFLLTWERSVRQAVCQDIEPTTATVVIDNKENVRVQTPKIQMIN